MNQLLGFFQAGAAPGSAESCGRLSIVHKPLNQYWTGQCSAGDLQNRFRPACGAAVTKWPYKLLWGYAGDNRTFPVPEAGTTPQAPARQLHHAAEAARVLAARAGKVPVDTPGFAPPSHESGAPCIATPCLFNIEGVSLYDSTFSRTVWRLYYGAKSLVM